MVIYVWQGRAALLVFFVSDANFWFCTYDVHLNSYVSFMDLVACGRAAGLFNLGRMLFFMEQSLM